MPRWELITGWVLRAGMLATAVIHAVLGDWAGAAICLIALGVAVTPTIVARTTSLAFPFEVELVVLWLAAAHLSLGRLLDLYERVPWFDKVLHFSDSLLIGFVAFLTVYVAHYIRNEKPHRWIDGIAILLATLGLGAFWEIIEFLEDQYLGAHAQGSPTMSPIADTMWDLIADGTGGVIAAIIGPRFMHHSRRSRERVKQFAAAVKDRRGDRKEA